MPKFVFNFAPTGMIPTRAMTPHVPLTPDEIIQAAREALPLGVNMVHLHARDPATGRPTTDSSIYAEIIQGIRAYAPDVILIASTSGRQEPDIKARAAALGLAGNAKPDMASLTLSSMNFAHQASMNAPVIIQELARRMKDNGIRPELEVFDTGMINYARYLMDKGILEPPLYFNVILGNIASAQCDPLHLGVLLRDMPPDSVWSVGGMGRAQLSANVMGLAAGGGVRVGLEDNIWWDEERTKTASNVDLVTRIRDIARKMHLKPYTPGDLRVRLNLPAR